MSRATSPAGRGVTTPGGTKLHAPGQLAESVSPGPPAAGAGFAARPVPARKKLTPQQKGRLGGLTAADRMSAEARSERARKGGEALAAKRGSAYFARMALHRHGYDVRLEESQMRSD
jgi:hypothetical protein